MAVLNQLLDEVLAGRRTVRHPSTFRLLRRFAPEKTTELNKLEAQDLSSRNASAIVENNSQQSHVGNHASIRLTRNEMEAVLGQERPATVEEVEWLLAHSDDHNVQMSETEELELQNVAARLLANRHIADVRARHHNDEFIAQTLGTFRTEYGDLLGAEIDQLEAIRSKAVQAIEKCDDHEKRRCKCWRSAREALFDLRCIAGEGSPVAMGALAVWNSVEAVARDRPRVQDSITQQDGPPGIIYNWRHFKSPEYVEAISKEN